MHTAANILLVDDDPAVLRALDRSLRQHGYQTIPVADPVRARQMLEVVPVDAIVADLDITLEDGRYFAAAVREECSQPLVVVTGTSDFQSVAQMLGGRTPQGLLAKPVRPAQLAMLVRSLLPGSALLPADERRIVTELAQGMARALAVRDVETNAHAERVALWTRRLAIEIGLPDAAVFWAETGALLHDVGKIGVPDRILHKAGSLAPDEWALMKRHPVLGGELIAPIARLAHAKDLVVHHHEAWDGSGYPNGLVGEGIPLAARLFAPVDTYDAITNDRPYRKGRSHDEAMARILAGAGTQFDPTVVEALRRIDPGEWCAVRKVVDESVAAA